MALGGNEFSDNRTVILFERWAEVLQLESLSFVERMHFKNEIISFLAFCKKVRAPVSVRLIQMYLASLDEAYAIQARAALRWFYKAALRMAEFSGGGVDGPQGAKGLAQRVEARKVIGEARGRVRGSIGRGTICCWQRVGR